MEVFMPMIENADTLSSQMAFGVRDAMYFLGEVWALFVSP
jgi:hypothetical protein